MPGLQCSQDPGISGAVDVSPLDVHVRFLDFQPGIIDSFRSGNDRLETVSRTRLPMLRAMQLVVTGSRDLYW